jgi:hypothetical protein
MAIRINLLAEDQVAEEMRRKDPVKRAIWLASFVVFLVLLWGLTLYLKCIIARTEVNNLEAKWKSMEKAAKQVEVARKNAVEVAHRLSALTQFSTNRFLWANALEALQHSCVDNIQVIHLKADQMFYSNEGSKPRTNDAATATGKVPTAVEKISLLLEAKDFSARVAEQVPRYKEALANAPFFQARLQRTNSVLLTSMSSPQGEGQKRAAYAVFGLQLNFQEKERRLYE